MLNIVCFLFCLKELCVRKDNYCIIANNGVCRVYPSWKFWKDGELKVVPFQSFCLRHTLPLQSQTVTLVYLSLVYILIVLHEYWRARGASIWLIYESMVM